MVSNAIQEIQSKHIDIRYHYVWECIEQRKIEALFIKETENPTNIYKYIIY